MSATQFYSQLGQFFAGYSGRGTVRRHFHGSPERHYNRGWRLNLLAMKKSLSKLRGWKRFVRRALMLFHALEALALCTTVAIIFFLHLMGSHACRRKWFHMSGILVFRRGHRTGLKALVKNAWGCAELYFVGGAQRRASRFHS